MWSYLLLKLKEEPYRLSILHFFYSVSKGMTHKPSKVVAAKNFFSSVCVLLLQVASINCSNSM